MTEPTCRLPLTRVLAPTDFSMCAAAALPWAVGAAAAYDAELHLLHVETVDSGVSEISWPANHFADGRELQKLHETHSEHPVGRLVSHEAGAPAPVTERIRRSAATPAEGILEYADAWSADLIVLSTHGRSGLERLLGSETARVVREAMCPVLTVHPEHAVGGRPADHPVRLLIPVDLSRRLTATLQLAELLLGELEPGVELHLAHVVDMTSVAGIRGPSVPVSAHYTTTAAAVQETLLEKLDERGLAERTTLHIQPGSTARTLDDLIADIEPAAMALLTRGRKGLEPLLLGSVADHLMRHTRVPMLTLTEAMLGG